MPGFLGRFFFPELEQQLTAINARLDLIRGTINVIKGQGVEILATLSELQAKLEAINTAIVEERVEVQGLLDALRAQIQILQDQIGAGQLVTQAQLDDLAASADAIVDRVRAISEPTA